MFDPMSASQAPAELVLGTVGLATAQGEAAENQARAVLKAALSAGIRWYEIAHAGQLGLDYALLGPVLPTPTHPENPGLGWDGFARLAAGNTLPVFALGGMRPELLATAQAHGAHGIALMRSW